ncbi:MAG: CHAT domain-containing tetratricopeptide repeat protein [Microscillaceae bacterium]|nr:CHAT domain-containing tetratricopeptide repeat protein [Microscillaceae bacterium]
MRKKHTKLLNLVIALFVLFALPLHAQESWQSLSDQGVEAFFAAQYQLAVEYFQKAILQAEKEFGKDHPNYVISSTDLADTYRRMGLYTLAEPLYLNAKQTIDATLGEAHPYYTTNRVGLAELYFLQGKYDMSEPLYLEAKQVDEKTLGKNHPDYAISCNNLAILYSEQGLYPQAEPLIIEAKNIREKTLGKSHPDYAGSCNNLATIYHYQGLYDKAELLYQEAKNINEVSLGKEHPEYANSCNNLAALYYEQKQYDKAELLYIEAKNVFEKALGKEHFLYANSCNNLAFLYQIQGKYTQAEPLYLEARDIREKTLGKEHLRYAGACTNLARFYALQAFYEQAETLFLEAKSIVQKSAGRNHPLYATVCSSLADMYKTQTLYTQAEPLYREALQNQITQMQTLLPTLSEVERKAYLQSIQLLFEDFYAFAAVYSDQNPGIAADLFNLRLILKGALFQSTQKMQNQILNSGNQALIDQYKNWRSKRTYLSKLLQLSLAEKEKQGISPEAEKKLADEANELERELSRASELFVKALDQKTLGWQDVQAQLKKDEALIELIRINQKDTSDRVNYMALIITPETQNHPQILLIENGEDLEKRSLAYYRNYIKTLRPDKLSYDRYFAPFTKVLSPSGTQTKYKRIYLSPDGVYHQVNLLTLLNPRSGKYLSQEIAIQLISNPKDLITYAQKPRQQKQNFRNYQIHLFGFPQYRLNPGDLPADTLQKDKKRELVLDLEGAEPDSTLRFLDSRGKINLLPGTKVEVENIQKTAQKQHINTYTYLSEDASEENVKKLQNPDFLHIATHGFFLKNLPSSNEDERGFAGIDTKKYVQNPLLRCGLLMAGAETSLQEKEMNPNSEDGILTAQEAINLNLEKTELVVLSACETGLGEISNGEGVYGLQRALRQAGAQSILMSLWTVSDEATQELMSTFYKNLLIKKQNKRQAFLNAQNSLMDKYPEPYFWGAFVMVGE